MEKCQYLSFNNVLFGWYLKFYKFRHYSEAFPVVKSRKKIELMFIHTIFFCKFAVEPN